MSSDRKIRANRANARASSGPKTSHGRARTATNAFRHGLSFSIYSDHVVSAQVDALARQIAGPNADPELLPLARRIAEAQLNLLRVRRARHQLLLRSLADAHYDTPANNRQKISILCAILDGKYDVPLDLDSFVQSKLRDSRQIDRALG